MGIKLKSINWLYYRHKLLVIFVLTNRLKNRIVNWRIKNKWISKVGLLLLLAFMYNVFVFISDPYNILFANYTSRDLMYVIVVSLIDCWVILESSFLIYNLLEKRFPWIVSPWLRFTMQSLLMIIVMVSLFFVQDSLFYLLGGEWTSNEAEMIAEWRINVISIVFSLMVSGIHTIYYMLQQWRHSLEETTHLQFKAMEFKEVAMQAELQALKSQLNPHFMFNNFSVLSELIDIDKEAASVFLNKLSKVYRYMIHNQKRDLISLNEEIEFVRSYFHLMHIRHQDNVNLEINIDKDVLQMYIPPITVQLLIENAIKHNVASKDRPLLIKITAHNDNLIVANNLQLIANVFPSTGVGLKNIKDRYNILGSERKPSVTTSEKEYSVCLPLFNFNMFNNESSDN